MMLRVNQNAANIQLATSNTNENQQPLIQLADGPSQNLKGDRSPEPPKLATVAQRAQQENLFACWQPTNKISEPQLINKPEPAKVRESLISKIPRLSLRSLSGNQQPPASSQQQLLLPSTQLADLGGLLRDRPTIKEDAEEKTKVGQLDTLNALKATEQLDEEDEEEIEDVDKSTNSDAIFLVSDIAKDIYQYMFDLERQQSIREDFLKGQKIMTPNVRQRLVNWCIETHSQLKLLPETLYMTIAVIDSFFDKVSVKQQSQVQLVAVAGIFIASKYEEIYPPDISDLVHLTQNVYSRREILRAEIQILEQLEFNLGRPIALAFLRRFSKVAHCDLKMHSIAKYLMELSLNEYKCAHWHPSLLAAAALFTTIHLVHNNSSPATGSSTASKSGLNINEGGSLFRRRPMALHTLQPNLQHQLRPLASSAGQQDRWTKTLVHYTHYSRKQLQEPAGILCKVLKSSQKSPQSYACVKKNIQHLSQWPELKSTRVDELIKLSDQI